MAKKANSPVVTEEKVNQVEEVAVEPTVDAEKAVEETPTPEEVLAVEEPVVVEAPKPVVEKKDKKESSQVKVVKIVQKTPSGFRLLLETGEIVRVSKKDFTKGQEYLSL